MVALGGARPLKRTRSDDEALGRWAGGRGRARGRCRQMRRRWGLACADHGATGSAPNWLRGVTASTLDSASSDRGSSPREASVLGGAQKERMLDRLDRRRARPEVTCSPCRPCAPVACTCKSEPRRSARQGTPGARRGGDVTSDPVAQSARHRRTGPGFAGSSPAGVVLVDEERRQ